MQTSFSPSCSDLFGISEQSYVQMKLTLDSKWPRLGSDFPRHNGHVMSRLCPIKLANLHDSTITSLLLRPVVSVMLRWKSQIWSSQINGKSSVLVKGPLQMLLQTTTVAVSQSCEVKSRIPSAPFDMALSKSASKMWVFADCFGW